MQHRKIRVIPRAKKNQVVAANDDLLKVYVTPPPTEGKANKAVVELLAEHFSVPKSSIHIIKGLKSRNKLVKIED